MLPFSKILCPTDFSEPSYRAMAAAGELAVHFGAEIVLAHVLPDMPPVTPTAEKAETEFLASASRALDELIKERLAAVAKVTPVVEEGEAAEQILKLAAAQKADLIVIATHGQTGWRHLVFGSVAEKVVRQADCPVLTIRAPQE